MLETTLELHNKLLRIYRTQYNNLAKAKKEKIKVQKVPQNLSIDLHLDENEDENDSQPMPPLESDEEAKLYTEKAFVEKVKLIPQKRKNEGT